MMSGAYTDPSETDYIKAKLHSIMDYVNELQLCYDEMLESFGQFEVSANERIKAFEEKLVNAVNYAKIKESEVSELLALHNEMSHELRREERIQHNQTEQLLLIEEELKEAKETIEKLYTELKKVDGKKLKVLDYDIDEISYVNKLCETIKELEIKNDKLQLERKHDKKEISILNDEIRLLQSQKDSLTSTIENLQSMYDEVSEQLKSKCDSAVEKNVILTQQLADSNRQLKCARKRSSEMEAHYKRSFEKVQEEIDVLRKTGKTQQSSDRRATHKRLQVLTQKVSHLEAEQSTAAGKLQDTENVLASVEQEKRALLHKLSTLEEQYSILLRNNSQQKLELSHYHSKLKQQHNQYFTLKKEYDGLVSRVTTTSISNECPSLSPEDDLKESQKDMYCHERPES